jgi:hypothetical protein
MPDVICDRCGFRKDLLAAISDDAARQAIAQALRLPAPLADATLRYMALFESAGRGLTWPRYAKILESLVNLMGAGTVRWKGNHRVAAPALWAECLREMVEHTTLELPLKNHNYLVAMVYRKADAVEAQAERQREEQRRTDPAKARQEQHGKAPEAKATEGAPKPVAELMAEAKAKLRGGLKSPPPTGEG